MEAVGAAGLLDSEMLQIQDISPSVLKANANALEGLFSQWLSLPETLQLVKSLIADAKSGASLDVTGKSTVNNAASSYSQPSTSSLSPCSSFGSSRVKKQILGSSLLIPHKLVNKTEKEAIPQFYFACGRRPSDWMINNFLSKVNRFFPRMGRPKIDKFKSVTKDICGLPSFLSTALFKKIVMDGHDSVGREEVVAFWIFNMLTMDLATQVYTILKGPDRSYLIQDDFKPALQELLATHPGLKFFRSKPEFHDRYAETVIYRIFYYNNRSGNGRLTLRELKRGNLIATMQHVDEARDTSKVWKYFCYDHVYVIYSIYLEFKNDFDFFVHKEDLRTYNNCALNDSVVDRIFDQIPRKFNSNVEGKMDYEDFVYFLLAEEDKSAEPSLEYWFKCIDLDGNGVLTLDEMQVFLDEQLERSDCDAREPLRFENIACQIFDMIGPHNNGCITLREIKRCKLSGTIFNILTNFHKFTDFQKGRSQLIHQKAGDSSMTDWDRFADRELSRLCPEESEEASDGAEDVDFDEVD